MWTLLFAILKTISIAISVTSGIIYWYRSNAKDLEESKEKIIQAVLKFSAVFFLIIVNLSIHKHNKLSALTAYAAGDVAIIIKEEVSLVFFGIGHVFVIVDWLCYQKSFVHGHWWSQLVELPLSTYSVILPARFVMFCVICTLNLILTTIFLFAFLLRNESKLSSGLQYGLYIFLLGLVAILAIISEGRLSFLLFVLSDLIIGFRFKRLAILSYPMYYTCIFLFLW